MYGIAYTLQWAAPSMFKITHFHGDLNPPPSNTRFIRSNRLSISNGISIGSAVFAQLTAKRPYTLHWAAPCPQNCPLQWGDLDSHLIHDSLSPSEPITQTASRSVQPFLQAHDYDRQTDRPTDHATGSVSLGRIYVR